MPVDESVKTFFLDKWPGIEGSPVDLSAGLVVGVSGGPDSVSLLNSILACQVVEPDRIIAAHLNHRLRNDAWEDARFVGELANSLEVHYKQKEIDVAALAAREGQSIEEAGRIARYRFLAEVAKESGIKVIATGHQADDQAETVLMHFLRGSGTAGLRGMSAVAPVPTAPELTLIRPLLSLSRAEILDYCHANGLSYRIDPSNTDVTIYRNRLRHELLPLLERLNPGIKERLLQTSDIVSADYALLQELQGEVWSQVVMQQRKEWLSFETGSWARLPLSLRRATLREAVHHLRPELRDVGFSTIEQARELAESQEVGSQATLPGSLDLTVDYGRLIISTAGDRAPFSTYPQFDEAGPVRLSIPGSLDLENNWRLTVEIVEDIKLAQAKNLDDRWQAFLSSAACPYLELRTKQRGERFQPLGMRGHSAKVSNVMINRKIPAPVRERWPLVAGPDHLVWLTGHHIDRRARIRADGQQALHLRMTRVNQVDLP